MLLIDGDFGAGTAAAVADARAALRLPGPPEADDALMDALAQRPEPSPELTAAGVTFIAREEVTSPSEYRRKYLRPVWPSASSGITIGIGYDLRFADESKLRSDWGGQIPASVLDVLASILGVAGSAERLARVAAVEVPLPAAVAVFLSRMLPEHIRHTRSAYPSLDSLPAARRTALISLVFNRGAQLEGDRRQEMKRVRELLERNEHEQVAGEFEAMTRLWDSARERGVIERRRREAVLWERGFAALQLA